MYGIEIIANSGISQYQQLYTQLRNKILQGSIAPGSKISSTRQLSAELKVSRSIVLEVLDQLKVEGFLDTRKGSGTFVMPSLTYKEGFSLPKPQVPQAVKSHASLSFIAGVPDLSLFPRRSWNQCYSQAVEYSSSRDLGYPHPLGRPDLRQVLQEYLFRTKGIKVELNQIILTAGSAQALALLAQLKANSKVVLEDPIAGFVHDIFESHGCGITFADVDKEGIVPESISSTHKDFIYVSPSHQFPLGGTLSAQRRIELLNLASKQRAYIIEDDYDGEYRYEQRPIAPMQVLGPHRVIYIGTFSKILSPALRLGYMVVPPSLSTELAQLKSRWDLFTEGLNQMAMVRFIQEGYLERHVRKMVRIYKARKTELERLIVEILGSEWNILGNTTGLHLILQLPGYRFDQTFKEQLRSMGMVLEPVDSYSVRTSDHQDKLVLGYGNQDLETLEKGLKILKSAVES